MSNDNSQNSSQATTIWPHIIIIMTSAERREQLETGQPSNWSPNHDIKPDINQDCVTPTETNGHPTLQEVLALLENKNMKQESKLRYCPSKYYKRILFHEDIKHLAPNVLAQVCSYDVILCCYM